MKQTENAQLPRSEVSSLFTFLDALWQFGAEVSMKQINARRLPVIAVRVVGIQADLKTFGALIVAQLLLKWRKIPVAYSRCIALSAMILSPRPARSVFSDVRINTTKIGVAETDIVEAVARTVATLSDQNISTRRTVCWQKAATRCFSPSAVATLCDRLLQVSLITPSCPTAALLDATRTHRTGMLEQGRSLLAMKRRSLQWSSR